MGKHLHKGEGREGAGGVQRVQFSFGRGVVLWWCQPVIEHFTMTGACFTDTLLMRLRLRLPRVLPGSLGAG